MKKIICMLLLFQGGFIIAQTETVVTVNGKKIQVALNAGTSDNGLTSDNGKIQLGGDLIKPTTIATSDINTLKIGGLQKGAITDQLLTIDGDNILRSIPNYSWSIKGNTGTNPLTDFIGNSDNKDLNFKINNIASGLLGGNNTSFGYSSINPTKVTGASNTAMGKGVLRVLTSGNSNSAFGDYALYNNKEGGANTAIGVQSLFNNVNGNWNIALGTTTLFSNIDGYHNIAIGEKSLYSHPRSIYNIGLGLQTLNKITSGNNNIAIGSNAISITKVSNDNIGIGNASLNNATGSYNTANGHQALAFVKTGDFNTVMGYQSGMSYGSNPPSPDFFRVSSMKNSVLIGANTRPLADNSTNEIVIGDSALGRGSNTVQIGNSEITSIGGAVNWSIGSDVRLKKDIVTSIYGLDFINKLRPVTYHLKKGTTDLQSGFIAQEVETVAKSIGYSFNGIVKPQTENDFYSLRYSEFVVPLVKAVQEQQQMIESQKADIEELKAQVQLLLQAVKK